MTPCGHPEPADRCIACWLAANSRDHQTRWGLPVTAPAARPPLPDWVRTSDPVGYKAARVALPCVHEGDAVPAGVAASLGLNPARKWHRCELGLKKGTAPAGVVCHCQGCNSSCEKYEPDATAGG